MTGLPAAARRSAASAPPRLRITDLGDLGGSTIPVTALNDRGVATGMATRHDGDKNGVTFKACDGQTVGMPWNGLSSWGRGINNQGVIAGHDSYPWRVPVQALDIPGAYSHNALGLNDSRQVCCWARQDPLSPKIAFVWQDGEVTLISPLVLGQRASSQAKAINPAGVVVGVCDRADRGTYAFLWQDGVMHELNQLIDEASAGWRLHGAAAINNLGQIVGQGAFNGVKRAFLATPVQTSSWGPGGKAAGSGRQA